MKKNFLLLCCMFSLSLFASPSVLIFAGSSRVDSYNKKLAKQAAVIAEKMGADVTIIDLKDYPIPFYNGDLEKEEGVPEAAKRLRDLMCANDAIIIASPEYNGSFSALLKNALDWASRGENGGVLPKAFHGKKFGLMSASPGKMGGSRGLVHLRAVIEDIGGEVVQKQVSLPTAYQEFNDAGELINSAFRKALEEEVAQVLIPSPRS